MSDITLVPQEGTSIAEMMGIPVYTNTSSQSALAQLSLLNKSIMGEVEVNGKKVKTEVHPPTSFKLSISKEENLYSEGIEIRTFSVRERWSKWLAEENNFLKSVTISPAQGSIYSMDLKDTKGSFNGNRHMGYVEDFYSLTPDQQQSIRNVKRTVIVLGEVKLNNPVDEEGNVAEEYADKWTPCVFEFKNMPSYNKLKKIFTSLQSKSGETGTIVYSQKLTGVEATMANGNTYAVFESEIGDNIGHLEGDSDKLIIFSDWITRHDKYVTDEWSKANAGSFSASDADLVSSMVNVEETS